MSRKFGGKLLLFGEYTVLLGGKALATPLNDLYGQLAEGRHDIMDSFLLHILEADWSTYQVNLDQISSDIGKLHFDSNIPIGYGCGSSGALTAAVYDRYFGVLSSIQKTQSILAKIESYFHGESSGFDPLISYYNRPYSIENEAITEVKLTSLSNLNLYLLDSGKSRNTKQLVQLFQAKLKENLSFAKEIQKMTFMNNSLIENWLTEGVIPMQNIEQLSILQREQMQEFIPKEILNIWNQGLETGDYYCKLCGAGGGGFFLLFTGRTNLKIEGFDLHEVRI